MSLRLKRTRKLQVVFLGKKRDNLILLLCPVFLVIKNPINRLRLHQLLGTTEVNKSLKTDANLLIGFLMSRKTVH